MKCKQCGQTVMKDGWCEFCNPSDSTTILGVTQQEAIPESVEPEVGQQPFGDYQLIEEIGRGGMGVIFHARHTSLNRDSALKMLIGGEFSTQEQIQRFRIEAEAAAKLDHPGIVPIYEAGSIDGKPYFAMKLVEGGSLASRLDEYQSNIRSGIALLETVALAVSHAHQRGILHRDLKPANILLDADDQPLVADFGLAKNTTSLSDVTHTGAIIGTPSYMSPEQASSEAEITVSTDIYSLGAILYELLTGMPPFKQDNAIDTLMKVREGDVPPPSKHFDQVDPDLELICLKCLSKDPSDRYETAQMLAKELRAWLNGMPLSVRSPRLDEQLQQWFRRNRQLAYAGFMVLMGIIITSPFVLSLVGGQDYASVYDHFPIQERPWLFSMGTIPKPVQIAFGIILPFILWPSVGFLNALLRQPDDLRQSLQAGVITSAVLIVTFTILLGWLPLIRMIENQSQLQILTEAIWPKQGQNPSYRHRLADEMFPGLQDVPIDQRATVVARRITSDRIASAPAVFMKIFFIEFILAVPVIYGTVLASNLIRRRQSIVMAFIRYSVAWWLVGIAMLLVFDALFDDILSGKSSRYFQAIVQLGIAALACLFLWCVLKRYENNDLLNNS